MELASYTGQPAPVRRCVEFQNGECTLVGTASKDLPYAHLEDEHPAPLCAWSHNSRVGICKVLARCASLCAAVSSRHWNR